MKVFKDPIHGDMCIPDFCVKIIDTPQFQRLRNIKQLTAETVYPGATHTRFAHCIGVCFLAGRVIKHLKEIKPLICDDTEVRCVQLAGLCHDLGHGPLSHKFEAVVNRLLPEGETWTHEEASVKMLHHLNKENEIGLTEEELNLICDLISGKPPEDADKKRHDHYKKKRFLYQIVANKDTGIDVDKWDYFARDCHYLGLSNSFDHLRLIPFMRVCECERPGDGQTLEICYRDKLMRDVSAMFAVRWDLHDRAYQHKVVKLAEAMYADALCEYFSSKTAVENFGLIQNIIKNMGIYSKIDDRIIGVITYSNGDLEKARQIIKRIQTRDLYQCIGEFLDADIQNIPKNDEINKLLIKVKSLQPYCSEENLLLIPHKYDYGMKDKNPLEKVYFYTKDDDTKGILFGEDKMPPTLPRKIQLRDVRLYTRQKVSDKKQLGEIRKQVKQVLKIPIPEEATPHKKPGSSNPSRPFKRENPDPPTDDIESKRERGGAVRAFDL